MIFQEVPGTGSAFAVPGLHGIDAAEEFYLESFSYEVRRAHRAEPLRCLYWLATRQ